MARNLTAAAARPRAALFQPQVCSYIMARAYWVAKHSITATTETICLPFSVHLATLVFLPLCSNTSACMPLGPLLDI